MITLLPRRFFRRRADRIAELNRRLCNDHPLEARFVGMPPNRRRPILYDEWRHSAEGDAPLLDESGAGRPWR